jgi:hypothetical protein
MVHHKKVEQGYENTITDDGKLSLASASDGVG